MGSTIFTSNGNPNGTSPKMNSARRTKFDCTINSTVTFNGTDLTHADFGKVAPKEFRNIEFLNGAVLDWAIVPYSKELEDEIGNKPVTPDASEPIVKQFAPGPVRASNAGVILAVTFDAAKGKYIYRGVIKYTDGGKVVNWSPQTQHSALEVPLESLTPEQASEIGLGEIYDFDFDDNGKIESSEKELNFHDFAKKKRMKEFVGRAWNIEFP
jgi:hypothetical protein